MKCFPYFTELKRGKNGKVRLSQVVFVTSSFYQIGNRPLVQ